MVPTLTLIILSVPGLLLAGSSYVAALDNTWGVDSPAFVFSPGTWSGDAGRGGTRYRQTWNAYAYARITWATSAPQPTATLRLDTSTYDGSFPPPRVALEIDGVLKANLPAAHEIPITGFAAGPVHRLVVYLQSSEQTRRWGTSETSGANVLRITGLSVDADATPVAEAPAPAWALIVGDSITEGIGTTAMGGYAYLLGRSLQTQGYEVGISACGFSGWLARGDKPPGDVPGYYVVTGANDGVGGTYHDDQSRWNRIDARTSLLDGAGRLSAHGGLGQEPAVILVNYGTNDRLRQLDPSDTRAAITQGLAALRAAAPNAQIIVLIPFGQFYAKELHAAVQARRQADDRRVHVIDLGDGIRRALDDRPNNPETVAPGEARKALLGNLHPNDRGAAYLAALVTPQVLAILRPSHPLP